MPSIVNPKVMSYVPEIRDREVIFTAGVLPLIGLTPPICEVTPIHLSYLTELFNSPSHRFK